MATETKLIFTLSDGSEEKFALSREGTYTLGTAKSCHITLSDPSLEEEHAKLVADETNDVRWFLQIISDNTIEFLEHGTTKKFGHIHLEVFVTEVEEPKVEVNTEVLTDNDSQLTALKKAQEMRELKSSIALVTVFGILSFGAGVAVRLMTS